MAEIVVPLVELIASLAAKAAVDGGESMWRRSQLDEACRQIREAEEMRQTLASIPDRMKRGDGGEEEKQMIKSIRRLTHEVEDIIDDFAYSLAGRGCGGFRASIRNAVHYIRDVRDWQRTIDELKRIKHNIDSICRDRRLVLNIALWLEDGARSGEDSSWPPARTGSFPRFGGKQNIVGTEEKEELLVRWLTEDATESVDRLGSDVGDPRHMVISVMGMPGLGKITLAERVYNDHRVKHHFKRSAWVIASNHHNVQRILRSMATGLQGQQDLSGEDRATGVSRQRPPNGVIHEVPNHEDLVAEVRRLTQGSRFFVVFDDVRNRKLWDLICEVFQNSKSGSRILLTTWDSSVANSLTLKSRILQLNFLHPAEAWSLFCKTAFWGEEGDAGVCPEHLAHWGKNILNACDGLPVAIVSIARVMALKDTTTPECQNFYEGLCSEVTCNEELRSMKSILLASYYNLPIHLKRCFLYCSTFPGNCPIKRKRLIRLWVAFGCAQGRPGKTHENVAQEYMEQLISRSMLLVVDS